MQTPPGSRATYMWHEFPAEINEALALHDSTSEYVAVKAAISLKKTLDALLDAIEKDVTIMVSTTSMVRYYVTHNSLQ